MNTVTIAYALDENGKQIIGVSETLNGAVQLIQKSGYDLTDHEATLLALLNHTTNKKVNFKLETWQVHKA